MAKHEPFDHLGFMKSPGEWPMWPILPVKKRVGMALPVLGIMREDEDGVHPTVYLTNLYELQIAGKKWADIEKVEYLDFEGLLDAGWVVD